MTSTLTFCPPQAKECASICAISPQGGGTPSERRTDSCCPAAWASEGSETLRGKKCHLLLFVLATRPPAILHTDPGDGTGGPQARAHPRDTPVKAEAQGNGGDGRTAASPFPLSSETVCPKGCLISSRTVVLGRVQPFLSHSDIRGFWYGWCQHSCASLNCCQACVYVPLTLEKTKCK